MPKSTRKILWRHVWCTSIVFVIIAGLTAQAGFAQSSLRRTPLVNAIKATQDAVVNIRGRKSVPTENTMALASQKMKQVNGMGTGVIIDKRGYVLTNYHVVEDVKIIKVTTSNGESMKANLVAHDKKTDLAIIKIPTTKALPVIPIGTSSDILLGETVVAIGNAYGYEHTITVGVVSALKRQVQVSEEQVYNDLIQTDASINPGNSGGPLINLDGEMVGINVAVRVNAQGIAFAIPVNSAMAIATALLEQVVNNQAYNGLHLKTLFLNNRPVAIVDTVDPESPAAVAGFQAGDRIRTVAGQVCSRAVDVQCALLDRRPGQQLRVEIEKNGEKKSLSLKLGRPELTDGLLIWEALGVRLAPVDQKVMRNLGAGFELGMQIVQVRPNSPAHRSNMNKGDILVAMDGWKTETVDNVSYILNQTHVKQQKPFEYYIFRGNRPLYGKVRIARAGD